MGAPEFFKKPLAPAHKLRERRSFPPDQRRRPQKIPAVGHQIPIARKPPHLLDRRKIHRLRRQHLIRRVRAVNHLPIPIVPHDRRAAKPLENPHLNFLRAQRHQSIESGGETGQILPRQPHDQIRVHVHARFRSQKPQIFFQLEIVLPPTDSLGHFLVESLNPHLKLKRARRKLANQLAQRLRQAVRDHLEVQKQS